MTYVAYCVPSGDTWKTDTAVAFGGLCARSSLEGIETCIMNFRVCSVAHSRNLHVLECLKLQPRITHIMWIDSDMSFPPDGLVRLLAHDKDIVGAFYPQKVPPYKTVGHPETLADAESGAKLIKATIIGGGFVLAKREVYERIEDPWYEERYWAGNAGLGSDDVVFSHKCRLAGIELWADLSLSREIGHSGNNLVRFAES